MQRAHHLKLSSIQNGNIYNFVHAIENIKLHKCIKLDTMTRWCSKYRPTYFEKLIYFCSTESTNIHWGRSNLELLQFHLFFLHPLWRAFDTFWRESHIAIHYLTGYLFIFSSCGIFLLFVTVCVGLNNGRLLFPLLFLQRIEM